MNLERDLHSIETEPRKVADVINFDLIKDKENIYAIIDELDKADNIVVSSHISPDGDNIGSSMGLINTLIKLNKNVFYVLDDEVPKNLVFLTKGVKKLSSEDFLEIIGKDSYIVLAFDCADRSRICLSDKLLKNTEKLINIDHHFTNDLYGDLNYVQRDFSSSCELAFNLIALMEEKKDTYIIDSKVASPLYAGILTDTGNFKFESSKPSTLRVAAFLLERGADKITIVTTLFQNKELNVLRLLGHALMNIKLIGDKVSLVVVDIELMKKYKVSYDQIDLITDYTRDIEGIEVGIFIKQKSDNEFKLSLRSKKYIDVSEIAGKLGGGGHKRAAGASLKGDRDQCINKVVEVVRESVYA